MAGRFAVVQGDITVQQVDAIVNAANSALSGGGGVDGAIHAAAGPQLLEECRKLGSCPTGEARITRGYNLPARWVIHAVGPVWQAGPTLADFQLACCYRNTFALAREHGIHTIAFPSISTGAYRFPLERASRIAVREIKAALGDNPELDQVLMVCFDPKTYRAYEQAAREVFLLR